MSAETSSDSLIGNAPHGNEEELNTPLITSSENNKLLSNSTIPCRYTLTGLLFAGFFNAFCVRNSFNLALVAMVNFTSEEPKTNSTKGVCPGFNNTTNDHQKSTTGEFDWDYEMQGQLLSAFYYGYTITQLPGGYLAERFGAKKVLCFTVAVPSLLCILTPLVARYDVRLLLASRILMGLCQGALYPANHAMIGRWAPLLERSILFSVTTSGSSLANIVAFALTGFLCSLSFLGGWPLPFYIYGILGLIWTIPWMLLVYDSPELHPRISDQEKEYIQEGSGHARVTQYQTPPWLQIASSKAVWAIVIYSLADGIAYYCIFTCIPLYLRLVLNFTMSENGAGTAAPQAAQFITGLVAGVVADMVRSRRCLTTKSTRKLFTFVGEGFGVIMVLSITFVECNATLVVVFVAAGSAITALSVAGASVNHLDIAPMYAGTLQGISNTASNIGGIVAPLIVTAITHDQADRNKWGHVFYVTAALYAVATGTFVLLGEGELQPWARPRGTSATITVGETLNHQDEENLPDSIAAPNTALNC